VGELVLFLRFCRARTRGELQYRAAFAAFTISQAIVTFLDCVVVLAIFTQVDSFGGWDRGQVLFLYAVSVLSFGLADLTYGSVEYAAVTVLDGSFDAFLVRPARVLTQLLGNFFALRRTGRLLQGIVILIVLFSSGDVTVRSPLQAVFAVAMVLGGALTFSAVFVITNSVGFFIPGARELANSFTYGGSAVSTYPVHIFGSFVRNFMLWVIPAGFVAYVPSIYVLDASNPLGIPRWLQLASPLAFIPFGMLAAAIWRLGVRHYESTGS
jgi:ABC-2 type transport system permease protein